MKACQGQIRPQGRVTYLPPHITVDTIGSSKHLVLSMWTDAASVSAESNDMADAVQLHGAGAELVARLRGTNARFEVSWNAGAYKELWDDISDLVMEDASASCGVRSIAWEVRDGRCIGSTQPRSLGRCQNSLHRQPPQMHIATITPSNINPTNIKPSSQWP